MTHPLPRLSDARDRRRFPALAPLQQRAVSNDHVHLFLHPSEENVTHGRPH